MLAPRVPCRNHPPIWSWRRIVMHLSRHPGARAPALLATTSTAAPHQGLRATRPSRLPAIHCIRILTSALSRSTSIKSPRSTPRANRHGPRRKPPGLRRQSEQVAMSPAYHPVTPRYIMPSMPCSRVSTGSRCRTAGFPRCCIHPDQCHPGSLSWTWRTRRAAA